MIANENNGCVSTWIAIRRMGWNGDNMKSALWAENRNIVPPLEMTMKVRLSKK